jgi:hypothetical protein
MFYDVWEWICFQLQPYFQVYQPGPGLVGEYNGKFMCNQLVLKGGSSSHAAQPRSAPPPQLSRRMRSGSSAAAAGQDVK